LFSAFDKNVVQDFQNEILCILLILSKESRIIPARSTGLSWASAGALPGVVGKSCPWRIND